VIARGGGWSQIERQQNAWAYSNIFFVWEGSQDKCLVWPKCKLTLSVYWAKGRGATAKGRGRDHVNGSTSRKWSDRPLVAGFLVDLLLVRSHGRSPTCADIIIIQSQNKNIIQTDK
jgi:hypothetical protein